MARSERRLKIPHTVCPTSAALCSPQGRVMVVGERATWSPQVLSINQTTRP